MSGSASERFPARMRIWAGSAAAVGAIVLALGFVLAPAATVSLLRIFATTASIAVFAYRTMLAVLGLGGSADGPKAERTVRMEDAVLVLAGSALMAVLWAF